MPAPSGESVGGFAPAKLLATSHRRRQHDFVIEQPRHGTRDAARGRVCTHQVCSTPCSSGHSQAASQSVAPTGRSDSGCCAARGPESSMCSGSACRTSAAAGGPIDTSARPSTCCCSPGCDRSVFIQLVVPQSDPPAAASSSPSLRSRTRPTLPRRNHKESGGSAAPNTARTSGREMFFRTPNRFPLTHGCQ